MAPSGVEATLKYVRALAEDGAQSAVKNAVVDQIEMEISFAGDLSEEQKQRLSEIADRCPTHRMLASQVHICSKLR
jgi:uncharacterized OsmC-like protein